MVVIAIMAAAIMADILKAGTTETTAKPKTRRGPNNMKTCLLLLTVVALLATGGCSMFSSSRNAANDRDHPGNGSEAGHSSVLGQGENRGN